MSSQGRCDVLLCEAGGRVGYQVLRSLARHGLRVGVCDSSDRGMSFRSRYAVRKAVSPSPVRDPDGYARFVASEAASSGAVAVLPIFYPEVLSERRKMLPEGVLLPVETPEKLRMLDDKLSACSLAASLGIRQPRMYADPAEVDRWPAVFKRTSGLGGSGVYFPKDAAALSNLVSKSRRGGYLIMDFIDGSDVCVDAVRWGSFYQAWAYRVLEPRTKGMSVLRESVEAPELISSLKSILDEIDYNGLCGCDFRVDDVTGESYFLECNPRFSGGLGSQIASGFDQPYVLWRAATGLALDCTTSGFISGKVTESLGDALALLNRKFKKRTLSWAEVRACLGLFGRTFDDFYLDDLRAGVYSLLHRR